MRTDDLFSLILDDGLLQSSRAILARSSDSVANKTQNSSPPMPDQVRGAERLAHHVRGLGDHAVACRMPLRVIESLRPSRSRNANAIG